MQRQDGCGLILNIGSVSALRPAPGTAAYAAAKAGLVALTQALAIEWAPAVRVNCVTAGLVRTDDTAAHHGDEQALAAVAATVPLGRMATPDDIADACLLHTPSRSKRLFDNLGLTILSRDVDAIEVARCVARSAGTTGRGHEPRAGGQARADPGRRCRAVRAQGRRGHHRARARRRGRHLVREPVPPLRLEGSDGRRDPRSLPGGPARGLRVGAEQRDRPAHEAVRPGGRVSPGRGGASARDRDLPVRRQLPVAVRAFRLPRRGRPTGQEDLARGDQRRRGTRRVPVRPGSRDCIPADARCDLAVGAVVPADAGLSADQVRAGVHVTVP